MDTPKLYLVKFQKDSCAPRYASESETGKRDMTDSELREFRAIYFRKSRDLDELNYSVADKLSMLDKGQLTYFNILGFVLGPAWLAYFRMEKRALSLLFVILTLDLFTVYFFPEWIPWVTKVIFLLTGHFVGLLGFRWLWKHSNGILNEMWEENSGDYRKTRDCVINYPSMKLLALPIFVIYFTVIVGGYA
ncbi:MAG: DUF2628 domain-containing protein, partial [Deltaproteobacteria bacterium]|nr:DUF2628 domain-containing protein [Deltaproteobacteria bacterium]